VLVVPWRHDLALGASLYPPALALACAQISSVRLACGLRRLLGLCAGLAGQYTQGGACKGRRAPALDVASRASRGGDLLTSAASRLSAHTSHLTLGSTLATGCLEPCASSLPRQRSEVPAVGGQRLLAQQLSSEGWKQENGASTRRRVPCQPRPSPPQPRALPLPPRSRALSSVSPSRCSVDVAHAPPALCVTVGGCCCCRTPSVAAEPDAG
jgi:hypothetical protein